MNHPSKPGRPAGPRPVRALLQTKGSQLGRLLAHAREIDRLDGILAGLLEPSMAREVQVADLRGQCLVLITASAAIATRLKLDSAALLKSLNSGGGRSIRGIRVRIAPVKRGTGIDRKRRKLPDIAIRSLERFAADSGDDEIKAMVERRKPPATGES